MAGHRISCPTRVWAAGQNWFLFVFGPHLAVLRIYFWLSSGAEGCRGLNPGRPCARTSDPPAVPSLGPQLRTLISLSEKGWTCRGSLALAGDLQLPGPTSLKFCGLWRPLNSQTSAPGSCGIPRVGNMELERTTSPGKELGEQPHSCSPNDLGCAPSPEYRWSHV